MTGYRATLIFCIACLLNACAAQPRMEPTADFSPVHAIPEQKPRQVTGAIFTNGRDLFGDLRSYQAAEVQVGDLVTVLLNETTQASRTSGLSTNRTTTNDAIGLNQKNSILNKIGFGKGFFADANTDGATISSDGNGTAGQAASLSGSISTMVVEVLANGNLIIMGEKQLALTEGNEFIRVKGISYRGTGELASASRASWGTGLLYKFWPF
jgi:flagellar L-ring protein precursor FlgH